MPKNKQINTATSLIAILKHIIILEMKNLKENKNMYGISIRYHTSTEFMFINSIFWMKDFEKGGMLYLTISDFILW